MSSFGESARLEFFVVLPSLIGCCYYLFSIKSRPDYPIMSCNFVTKQKYYIDTIDMILSCYV